MSNRQKKRKRIFWPIVVVFLLVCGFFLGAELLGFDKDNSNNTDHPLAPGPQVENPPPVEDPSVNITIAAVGDILIHNTLYYAAYDPHTGLYDFSRQFQYVKPYLKNADITIANLETTLAGPEAGYAGYPTFNTPDSIVDALRNAGVDILTAANNHRMDQGIPGFYRTIRTVREKGLDIIGVKAEEPEKTYVIKDINGVKVAFLNFGYAYPLAKGGLDINGLFLPMNMTGLMDTINPQDLQESVQAVARRIAEAKEDGAEVIVACMHWGYEYHRTPNDFQQKLAAEMVALGVNIIFGGHPHVLQPAVILTDGEGNKVPVFYSLGNFISDQRKETVNDIYTEQGMIAKVTLNVQKGEKPVLVSAEAIPTWVNKKIVNQRFVYEVIPATEALESLDKFPLLNTADQERIRFCRDTVDYLTADL
ncbi:MAG: CapA family protein [Peptococcaceae bacterium]|nr:CapA family protein [Peptococcaceae bacterium]